ncbi:hypothetical protein BC828DRAFT_404516 [Blastocladiella britannica]|nr:hypothetical protein BC828DRAFT_404516 [Blastocladiella britannica]
MGRRHSLLNSFTRLFSSATKSTSQKNKKIATQPTLSPLVALPQDILDVIAEQYLPHSDLAALRGTCRELRGSLAVAALQSPTVYSDAHLVHVLHTLSVAGRPGALRRLTISDARAVTKSLSSTLDRNNNSSCDPYAVQCGVAAILSALPWSDFTSLKTIALESVHLSSYSFTTLPRDNDDEDDTSNDVFDLVQMARLVMHAGLPCVSALELRMLSATAESLDAVLAIAASVPTITSLSVSALGSPSGYETLKRSESRRASFALSEIDLRSEHDGQVASLADSGIDHAPPPPTAASQALARIQTLDFSYFNMPAVVVSSLLARATCVQNFAFDTMVPMAAALTLLAADRSKSSQVDGTSVLEHLKTIQVVRHAAEVGSDDVVRNVCLAIGEGYPALANSCTIDVVTDTAIGKAGARLEGMVAELSRMERKTGYSASASALALPRPAAPVPHVPGSIEFDFGDWSDVAVGLF